MNEHSKKKLSKAKWALYEVEKTIKKHENRLRLFISERDFKSKHSNDNETKEDELRKKISETELVLEQLIKKRGELENEIEYQALVDTKVKKDKKKISTLNVDSIVSQLIKKSKNNILSYDTLYNKIPPDIVSADLIDEIEKILKGKGIQVIDKIYKEDDVGQYLEKIDDEITEYERNIELQLTDLYKGHLSTRDSDDNVAKSQVSKDTSSKIATAVRINVTPPHLPRITDVMPKLTNESGSLLASKANTKIKETKEISLKRLESIEPIILIGTKSNSHINDISQYQGPKIFSKTRFDNDRRLSLYAKTVGDRAEEIVIKYLEESLPQKEKTSIRWISKAGETPGWDISYYNAENQLVAIEVKGTTGEYFPNVEITANEWNAAIELQERYWIYLVTGSFGINPQIQRLQNPVKLKESGILNVTPILWKIEMMSI